MRAVIAGALLVVGACSPELVDPPPRAPVNWASLDVRPALDAGTGSATAKEREIASRYLQALASPGFAELEHMLDDDAHFSFAGKRDAYTRRDIIKAHVELFGGFAPRQLVARRVLVTDSAQAIEWTLVGDDTDSHKPVAFDGVSLLWTKDDGTIANEHVFFDELIVRAQLGKCCPSLQQLPRPQPAAQPEVVEKLGNAAELANQKVITHQLDDLENEETRYVAAMAPDVEVRGSRDVQPSKGAAGAHAYWKLMQQTFARLDTQLDYSWAVGGYVVVEYHVIGEQRRAYAGVPPPKDALVKLYFVDVVEVRGGKIARVWRYDNPVQLVPTP